MAEEEKEICFDKNHQHEFAILSTNGTFFKPLKDKILAEKKEELDFYDWLNNNIASTEYPSPVLASKKELRSFFEKFPGAIDNVSFYRKIKGSETTECPYGEHVEFSRKDFDEYMKDPDLPTQTLMSKDEMEKMAKEMAKEFAKANPSMSKADVEKIVKDAVNTKISEMENNLARKIDETEKTRKADEAKAKAEAEAKLKASLADRAKEMVEEKAAAALNKRLAEVGKVADKVTEKGEKTMSERTYKDAAIDAAKFAGNNVLHGVKQKVAGETAKLLIDGLKAGFKDDPMMSGLLENEYVAQLIVVSAVLGIRTLAAEGKIFPDAVKGNVDELCALVLQNSGNELIAPMIAKLKPALITMGKQARKMNSADVSALAITEEDIDIEVEDEATTEAVEKAVARAKIG